eukprot:TRINITY_DN15984_c0_g2_i1.p2 TRINITY_DN15984_c0_g2~~TRINITY_DN15984_c0_g2_i1.p2  ORF type:complete len:100 (+),score=33.04 TRINITY_DN15984_c0_g2_i1:89-388(+)
MFFFFFFNDTATTEIYTRSIVGSVRCVQETVPGKQNDLYFTVTVNYNGPDTDLSYQWSLVEVYSTSPSNTFRYSKLNTCLLYTSPSPRDLSTSRMPSSA